MSSEREQLLPQVSSSLSKVSRASDKAAAAVAREYARLMDEAASPGLGKALRLVSDAVLSYAGDLTPAQERELTDAWARISSILAEHAVASDLGPKLLATLTALGLTPAGRGEKSEKGGGGSVTPIVNPLQLLRDQDEQQRSGRAAG